MSVADVSVVATTLRSDTAPGGVAGGAVTVNVVVPLTVPLAAVMVVVPAATLVASPLALSVATLGVPELHVIVRPVSTFPAESFVTALNCTPAVPTTIVGAAGVTVTEATHVGAVGVTVTDATGVSGVVALAVFDGLPSTAFVFSVPRKATTAN